MNRFWRDNWATLLMCCLAVGSTLGLIGGLIWSAERDNARYARWAEEAQVVHAYRESWWPLHCKRFYIAGRYDPMFNCDDGNVYSYNDMPTGGTK